jgi:hypothetical protein
VPQGPAAEPAAQSAKVEAVPAATPVSPPEAAKRQQAQPRKPRRTNSNVAEAPASGESAAPSGPVRPEPFPIREFLSRY